MLKIYPTFFPDFQCKADRCRHTCCQKWEIDIDKDTEKKYRSTKGPLGKELREWMKTGEEGLPCFQMNEKGYCHFLTEKGLCRLVLERGDDFLCQICRDHPRFYKFPYDADRGEEVMLCGTGLACERTVEQLLAEKGPLSFRSSESDRPFHFDRILTLLHLDEEPELSAPDLSLFAPLAEKTISRLEETNPIDREWTDSLSFIKSHMDTLLPRARQLSEETGLPFLTRLYQYIFYRQLDECEAYDPLAMARYAKEAVVFMLLEYARTGDLIRSVTRWSEQIEYDTENVYILLDSMDEE